MSEELFQAIKSLQSVIEKEASATTTAVRLYLNCEGYDIEYQTRTAEALKLSGVSMRNIRGEWIQ